MNPLRPSSSTTTSRPHFINLNPDYSANPTRLVYPNYNEPQLFYPRLCSPSSTLRLALSDPNVASQPNIESNLTNIDRFSAGSSTPYHTQHNPLAQPYQFRAGPPISYRSAISERNSTETEMPFLHQAGPERAPSNPYPWIDRANHTDRNPPSSEQRSIVPASNKSASQAPQTIRHPPVDLPCPHPLRGIMPLQSEPDATQTDVRQSPATPASVVALGYQAANNTQADVIQTLNSKKKHGCWMCHKSFDRPSTLRKHLLVHTGEKAFVCETCGRRFGVNSNLNRHVKRCILRNPPPEAADDVAESVAPQPTMAAQQMAGPSGSTAIASSLDAPPPRSAGSNKRKATTNSAARPTQPSPKRRRRAASPNRWIPESLRSFNLFNIECLKASPVPLPPVSAYKDPRTNEWIEERNSWDENIGATPYHPCAWKGRLPGPGLGFGGKDVGNLGPVSQGFAMGRLVLS